MSLGLTLDGSEGAKGAKRGGGMERGKYGGYGVGFWIRFGFFGVEKRW